MARDGRFTLAGVTGPQPPYWRGGGLDGYPFGADVLVVKSIPSRMDTRLGCTIHGGDGRPVGTIRPVKIGGWQELTQFFGEGLAVSWEFEIVDAAGSRLLHIRRPRVRGWRSWRERIELYDPSGHYIGQLLQNNSYLATVRTFNLECDQAVIGHTTLDYKRIGSIVGSMAAHTVTIRDGSGRAVAGITQRQTTTYVVGNHFCDYTLTFEYPPYEPLGSLCLAVVFAEYFFRRTERGGTLRGIPGA